MLYLVIENYVLDLSQKTIFAYKDRETKLNLFNNFNREENNTNLSQ